MPSDWRTDQLQPPTDQLDPIPTAAVGPALACAFVRSPHTVHVYRSIVGPYPLPSTGKPTPRMVASYGAPAIRRSQSRWNDALVSMDVRHTQRRGCSILLILATVSGPLAGCSTQHVPDPTTVSTPMITTSATPVQTPAATASPSPSQDTPSSVVSAVVSNEVLTDVDPSQYRDLQYGAGYFFMSPSRNLSCGFLPPQLDSTTGCQAWVKVANFPPCDAKMSAATPAISFEKGKRATAYCLNQGVFSAGTKVLAYGQRLTVNGVTCTSRRTGVTCIDQQTGHGFTAAREAFTPVG